MKREEALRILDMHEKHIQEHLEMAIGMNTLYRQDNWDEARWIEFFKQYEQYPEAMKAMATMNSKLYKAVK